MAIELSQLRAVLGAPRPAAGVGSEGDLRDYAFNIIVGPKFQAQPSHWLPSAKETPSENCPAESRQPPPDADETAANVGNP